MTPFEHLFVLFSIILGLGLTELLSSFHHLLHPSARVRWHWLPMVWVWIVFQSIVFWWWAMFGFTALDVPNFFEMVLLLMAPVILYLMATSVLPDLTPGESVDLDAFYMANRGRLFGIMATHTAVLLVQAAVFSEVSFANYIWGLISLAVFVALARSGSRRVHQALTALTVLLSEAGIALYWLQLA